MNTPITSSFFKKLEIFQELVFQDKLFKQFLQDMASSEPINSTWEVEKKLLYWSRWGHKHLGSPIVPNRLKNPKDLQDLQITENEARVAGINETLRNLVQRGYAKFEKPDAKEQDGILITERGLLVGSVIYEIYRPQLITGQDRWKRYMNKSKAATFLGRSWKYWWYWLVIISGWFVFTAGVSIVVQKAWLTFFA